MPRIPPLDAAHISQDETPSIASMDVLFRVMAHRPELMQLSMQLLEAAMRSGTVDARLKELLAVRVSQVNHCYY